jgi:hypothetical protein
MRRARVVLRCGSLVANAVRDPVPVRELGLLR